MNRPSSHDWIDDFVEQAFAREAPQVEIEDEEAVEHGRPLTPSEIELARQELCQWQMPDTFAVAVKALCARCASKDWFNSPRLKFLHDAYVLSAFATAHEAESVRLAGSTEQWPDGYVKISGRAHNVEITSTHGGRRLGEEYRTVSGPTIDPVENWVARAESIPRHLDDVLRSKSEKRYSSPCWLVVYLNISEWGIRQSETEAVIAATKARYTDVFEAISVLWKERFY